MKLFPARESLVSDIPIPSWDVKIDNLFLQCTVLTMYNRRLWWSQLLWLQSWLSAGLLSQRTASCSYWLQDKLVRQKSHTWRINRCRGKPRVLPAVLYNSPYPKKSYSVSSDAGLRPALQLKIQLHVFLFWELGGLSPNYFHILVSVSDWYIPRISPHISCSRIGRLDRGNIYINRSQTQECGNWNCGCAIPFLGIFSSNFRYWFFALRIS
jgi:hypothetical protein